MIELSTTLNVYVGIALSFAIIFKTIDVIMECVQMSNDLEEEAKNKADDEELKRLASLRLCGLRIAKAILQPPFKTK